MSFALDLQNFAEKVKHNQDEVIGTIVTKVVAEVDLRSPVDTGRFRANWQLGVDTIPGGVRESLDPTGSATLSRNIGVIPEEAGGHVYSLTNNLPYALRLEAGWSRQAPQGMVGLTAVKFQRIVDEAAETLP